jgi:hypothetical protein
MAFVAGVKQKIKAYFKERDRLEHDKLKKRNRLRDWDGCFAKAERKFTALYDKLDRQGRLEFEITDPEKDPHHSCQFAIHPTRLEKYVFGRKKLNAKIAAYMKVHFDYCSGCDMFSIVVANEAPFWFSRGNENEKVLEIPTVI